MEGQLICVATEEDMIATTSSGAPYVEVDEKVLECFFRSLEFVNAMYLRERSKISKPKLSRTIHTTLKQLAGRGVRAEKGLGKRLQGMLARLY